MVINPMRSALAGMAVHAAKAAVAAHNIANVNTDEFKRSQAVIESGADGQPAVTVTRSQDPGPVIAERQGLPANLQTRELSNVNLAEEIVQMKIARYGYGANASVLLTQSEMLGSIIDLIA